MEHPPPRRFVDRPLVVSDSIVVPAAPQEVWAAVAEPGRIADVSPENTGADADVAGPLGVGDRFVGHNRRGGMTWSTDCEVVASEPGERFAFKVRGWGSRHRRVRARVASWEYRFEAVADGTRVTETWRDDRRWPDLATAVFDPIATGGRSFADYQRGNIRRTLRRLAEQFGTTAA